MIEGDNGCGGGPYLFGTSTRLGNPTVKTSVTPALPAWQLYRNGFGLPPDNSSISANDRHCHVALMNDSKK